MNSMASMLHNLDNTVKVTKYATVNTLELRIFRSLYADNTY